MDQVRPLTSLSQDELIARIEQYVVVAELRDAEIRELYAVNSALLAERDALRHDLETMVEMVEMNGFGRAYAMDVARAALAQEQEEA